MITDLKIIWNISKINIVDKMNIVDNRVNNIYKNLRIENLFAYIHCF